jgi:hypothetical protein
MHGLGGETKLNPHSTSKFGGRKFQPSPMSLPHRRRSRSPSALPLCHHRLLESLQWTSRSSRRPTTRSRGLNHHRLLLRHFARVPPPPPPLRRPSLRRESVRAPTSSHQVRPRPLAALLLGMTYNATTTPAPRARSKVGAPKAVDGGKGKQSVK